MVWARVAMSALLAVAPVHMASAGDLEQAFDRALGSDMRVPAALPAPGPSTFVPTVPVSPAAPRIYGSSFEAQIASLANASQGRIGVAALDLASGRTID